MPKQCRHIMTDGNKCHAIALREKPYCYYHMRVHRVMWATKKPSKVKEKTLDFAFPDTKASIQLALYQVMNAIGASQISPKRAGSLLYSLQIAAQTVPRSRAAVPDSPIMCVTETSGGDELGPACMSLNLSESCKDCISHGPQCIMHDQKELQMLEIAKGDDEPDQKNRSLPERLAAEVMRQLDGGITPEARIKIVTLMEQAIPKMPKPEPEHNPGTASADGQCVKAGQ